MTWGLTSSWALNDRRKPRPINIQSETLLDRPAYRRLLSLKRCLIPADGFYEWRRDGKLRQPYNIGAADGGMFGFAGLWDACKVSDDWLVSCAILTTKPNALVAELHNRQPVILQPDQESLWLDPSVTDPGELMPILGPLSADAMTMYACSPLVNNVNNEGRELRAPAESRLTQAALL